MKKDIQTNDIISNENINSKLIRVVDFNGENLGLMSKDKALDLAFENDMDLIEINTNEDTSICVIKTLNKFLYEKSKKEKDQKKRNKSVEIKELRLRPNTEQNDLMHKMLQAKSFLEKGDKVKLTFTIKGRENVLVDKTELSNRIIAITEEFAEIEQNTLIATKADKGLFILLKNKTTKNK